MDWFCCTVSWHIHSVAAGVYSEIYNTNSAGICTIVFTAQLYEDVLTSFYVCRCPGFYIGSNIQSLIERRKGYYSLRQWFMYALDGRVSGWRTAILQRLLLIHW